jgi:hypothetical protein
MPGEFVPLTEEEGKSFIDNLRTPPAAAASPAAPVAEASPETTERLVGLEELAQRTTEQLDALAKSLIEQKGQDPAKTEVTPDLLEQLADESEGFRALAKTLLEMKAELGEVKTAQQQIVARTQAEQETELAGQYEREFTKQAQVLLTKFPGLVEADFNKVFTFMGDDKNQELAARMNLEQAAAHTLGVDYLSDRRRGPSIQPGPGAGAPGRGLAPATLVDTTVPGGASAGSPAQPADRSIRELCDEALRTNPQAFGRYT